MVLTEGHNVGNSSGKAEGAANTTAQAGAPHPRLQHFLPVLHSFYKNRVLPFIFYLPKKLPICSKLVREENMK